MKWRIDYSRDAEKFIEKQNIRIEVREELKKFLMKMKGENVNIDLKKCPMSRADPKPNLTFRQGEPKATMPLPYSTREN